MTTTALAAARDSSLRSLTGALRRSYRALRQYSLFSLLAAPLAVKTSAAAVFVLTPIITVLPAVDVAGRARTIIISGQTYAGCPFAAPFVDGVASQLIGGVAIRLDPVQTLAPCQANVFTAYRFEIPYTPAAAGAIRVLAASSNGAIRSESRIRTTATQGRTRAIGDITGIWYDPVTNGSGLQFTHNFAGSDFVFGTWYLYELDGKSRWLSIQNVVWQADGTLLTGDLLETRSTPAPCAFPGCPPDPLPILATTMTKIGTARITFTGLEPYSDTQPQGIAEAFSLSGVSLFKSSISRIPL